MQEGGALRCSWSVVSGSSSLHTDLSSDIPLPRQGNKAVFAGGEQVRRIGAISTLSGFHWRCCAYTQRRPCGLSKSLYPSEVKRRTRCPLNKGGIRHVPLETSTGQCVLSHYRVGKTPIVLVGVGLVSPEAGRNVEQFNFHVVQCCSE